MKTIFKSQNKIALFNELNQGANKFSWYWCSLFAPAINLKYNCWITLTLEDLKIIWEKQIKLKLLDPNFGWKWSDGIKAVYNYVIENAEKRNWSIPNLIEFDNSNNIEVLDWIDRWYMVTLGIQVNKSFKADILDGKLDLYQDYNKYKWTDLAHFTNITRWKSRFIWFKSEDFNSEQFIDSYAFNSKWNPWIYKCNIEKVLNSFDMNTKYLFF